MISFLGMLALLLVMFAMLAVFTCAAAASHGAYYR
jgi:hypothetical protein